MDGSGHRDLGDIRRWKTLPPAAVGPSSSADLGSDASGLLGWLASGSRALEKAAVEPAWAVDEAGLATAMALLGQLRSLTDRLEISVTAEVLTRGTAQATGLSAADWIVDQQGTAAPRPDPRRVAAVVRVAETTTGREPGGQVIGEAVQAAVMPVRSAAQIARFVRDVKAVADAEVLERDVAVLTAAASDGPDGRGLTDRELASAIRYATNLTRADRGLDGDEERCRQARALWSGPGPAGMTSYRMVLDPEAATAVDSAISALSAPVKGADGEPDLRPASRRRADALLETIRRGVATSASLPGGTKTQIVVTIPLADLVQQLRGAGLTSTGQVLSPATVRRLACDAQLLPMVLGGHSELLDLGHGERYFTPAQRRAVARRDGHCTYPGCTRPAAWCDVHHLRWWSRGGPTNLDNAALLCERHHTLVHQQVLHGTVNQHGVTWHRRPPPDSDDATSGTPPEPG
jgi:Domain of unknown function (DUF222)